MGKIIYEPKGRAREYAPLAANIYNGCTSGCKYCFVPTIPSKSDIDMTHCEPRENVLSLIEADLIKMKDKPKELILLCFTCDPYPEIEERSLTSDILKLMAEHNQQITILTKAGFRAVPDIELLAENNWWFGTTMFALYDKIHQIEWEPHAASLYDRSLVVQFAHDKGIRTWISLEPSMSLENSVQLIEGIHPSVDHWKVGKLNHGKDLPEDLQKIANNTDWKEYVNEVEIALLEAGYEEETQEGILREGTYYIKNDLRKFRS